MQSKTVKQRNEKRDARIKKQGGVRTSLELSKQSLKDVAVIRKHSGAQSRAEVIAASLNLVARGFKSGEITT